MVPQRPTMQPQIPWAADPKQTKQKQVFKYEPEEEEVKWKPDLNPINFAPPPMTAPMQKAQSEDVKRKPSWPQYASAFN